MMEINVIRINVVNAIIFLMLNNDNKSGAVKTLMLLMP